MFFDLAVFFFSPSFLVFLVFSSLAFLSLFFSLSFYLVSLLCLIFSIFSFCFDFLEFSFPLLNFLLSHLIFVQCLFIHSLSNSHFPVFAAIFLPFPRDCPPDLTTLHLNQLSLPPFLPHPSLILLPHLWHILFFTIFTTLSPHSQQQPSSLFTPSPCPRHHPPKTLSDYTALVSQQLMKVSRFLGPQTCSLTCGESCYSPPSPSPHHSKWLRCALYWRYEELLKERERWMCCWMDGCVCVWVREERGDGKTCR